MFSTKKYFFLNMHLPGDVNILFIYMYNDVSSLGLSRFVLAKSYIRYQPKTHLNKNKEEQIGM